MPEHIDLASRFSALSARVSSPSNRWVALSPPLARLTWRRVERLSGSQAKGDGPAPLGRLDWAIVAPQPLEILARNWIWRLFNIAHVARPVRRRHQTASRQATTNCQ